MATSTIRPGKKNTNTGVHAGEIALDGSNPTAITTPFSTITGVALTISSASSTGVGTSVLTYANSSGTCSVYAWKVTETGNATLVASTGTETIGFVITGY